MFARNYDVAIIGAGIGGLGVGAVLAAKEHMRVLVVEKESFLGGRAVSFSGKGNKIVSFDKEFSPQEFKTALASTYTWIAKSEPELEVIFNKGLLDGYTFEGACHLSFWGNQGRISCLMKFLNRPIHMETNQGFAVVNPKDHMTFYQIQPGSPYPWMSEDSTKETKNLLREMATMSFGAIEKLDGSLGQWLKEKNAGPEAYDFIKLLATSQMVLADPDLIPIVDYMKLPAIGKDIGMNLISGSAGAMGEPGFTDVAIKLAGLIKENGGAVLKDTPVEQVNIEGGRAKGISIRYKSAPELIEAPIVVCNIPIKHIFKVLPEQHFPGNFVKEIKENYWGAGMVAALMGLKREIFEDKKINPRSFIFVPCVIKDKRFRADVDFVIWSSSNFARRAPAGQHTLEVVVPLVDKDTHEKYKVDMVINEAWEFLRKNFPTIDEDRIFSIWTVSDEGYGNWRPVGSQRPDVKCPWVEGLYFVGDAYGRKLWGAGIDAATLSAVLCVDSITRKNYEKQIFPPYHRSSV
jgi:hypothetical protein